MAKMYALCARKIYKIFDAKELLLFDKLLGNTVALNIQYLHVLWQVILLNPFQTKLTGEKIRVLDVLMDSTLYLPNCVLAAKTNLY